MLAGAAKITPLCVNAYDVIEKIKARGLSVVADIGANEGGWIPFWRASGASVHAFEPIPWLWPELDAKASSDHKVYVNHFGLSDTQGCISNCTVLNTWTVGNPAVVDLKESECSQGRYFEMTLDTLDAYASRTGTTFDFIKLDADGYEPQIIRGAQVTIASTKPPILCELSYLPCHFNEDIYAFVCNVIKIGYQFVSMDGTCVLDHPLEVMKCWPWDTSYDVMLIHRDNQNGIL